MLGLGIAFSDRVRVTSGRVRVRARAGVMVVLALQKPGSTRAAAYRSGQGSPTLPKPCLPHFFGLVFRSLVLR